MNKYNIEPEVLDEDQERITDNRIKYALIAAGIGATVAAIVATGSSKKLIKIARSLQNKEDS